MNGVAARAPVGWQRLTQKEHDEDKMSRMFVTTVSAIFVNRTHWSLSVRLFIRNFKLWQEPLIAGSVNFYKGKKKKVVRYKKKGLSFGTKMWIRVKMKSAWKLTQGLDWEQSLFCSKICERVQYIMQRSHEQRGCADATTTRCSRLRRVHLVFTNISQSLTGFRAKETALILGVPSELGYVLEYYFFCSI